MRRLLTLLLALTITLCSAQGDCPATCLSTGGTYSAATGTTDELGGGNNGCLSVNEATASYWFNTCFSSNGTFQFYMDPSGNRNDFDFAVWSGTACPPTTAPIRCSFAAVPPGGPCATCDYTGLGNGATDLSEGAGGNGYVAPITVTSGQCYTININNYGAGSNSFNLFFTGTTATMNCLLVLELNTDSTAVEYQPDPKEIKVTKEYYNILGQSVPENTKGLVIVKTTRKGKVTWTKEFRQD
jgi:hypothetical protein